MSRLVHRHFPACLVSSLLLACGAAVDPDSSASAAPAGNLDAGAAPATDAGAAGDAGSSSVVADSGSKDGGARAPDSANQDAGVLAPDASTALPDAQADGGATVDAAQPGEGTGAALWLSPTGSDENPGTKEKPLKTLEAAHALVKPGMTIWVGGGVYASVKTVAISKSGAADKPISVFAEPGERPVFDFSALPRGQSSARGLQITADYWHIRGLDVIKAGDNCIAISGGHNTIENVVTHGCDDTGIQITANSAQAADATRAAYNTVLNCDSYENYDAQNQGENADGFAAKLWIGAGNVFRGCRAWNNADDGWDLFASDDVVVIDNCWAMNNGKIGASQSNTNGDGNGFKLGGAAAAGDANQGGAPHKVSRCVALGNRACGFVRNNNTSVPELSMCSGQGDGKGAFCSLSSTGGISITLSAAAAIAAKRGPDGSLPSM